MFFSDFSMLIVISRNIIFVRNVGAGTFSIAYHEGKNNKDSMSKQYLKFHHVVKDHQISFFGKQCVEIIVVHSLITLPKW